MDLGLDKDKNYVYEGGGHYGHALWPTPIVVPAAFAFSNQDNPEPADNSLYPNTFIFRENSFDIANRIRRGIFYKAGNTQPITWRVYPHPALPQEARHERVLGPIEKQLFTFHQYRFVQMSSELGDAQPLVLLGTKDSFTIWTIASVETGVGGNELVVLKSRESFGALPKLRQGEIPSRGRANVLSALATLQEDIFTAGPESVIDRAREAATAILSAFLQEKDKVKHGLDLNDLLSTLRKLPKNEQKNIAANAADIVRLFHSRGKHAVKEKLPVRPIREQDAELAVQCVGTILCDLGWGEWR